MRPLARAYGAIPAIWRHSHFPVTLGRYCHPPPFRMNATAPGLDGLAPLDYHLAVADYLRQHEPEVWNWTSGRSSDAAQREALHAMLLRDTYRLDPAAHADIHALLATACTRLGVTAPAMLYQSAGQEMNAALLYVPGEVHILLQGPILERLSADELLAVLGHELAHYLLWSLEGGTVLVADRILGYCAAAGAMPSHLETWRRYALHTELFADRGAALAAGAAGPAIAALVKIHTGIGSVDPQAYLRQASDAEATEPGASGAHSHPETFVRARALALWWERDPALAEWIEVRLRGPLSLERLDLPGQLRLQTLTRGFLAYYLDRVGPVDAAVLAQVRLLFPDWQAGEAPAAPDAFMPAQVDGSVRAYLNALMLDLALADADGRDAALLHAGRIARALGSYDDLLARLRRDAGFGKRDLDRYQHQLDKEEQA
jgi:hypothetical protein